MSDEGGGQRILAVDDQESVVRIIQVNLERAGYRVDTASNGADALAQLQARRYDLLISDISMPEMDGLELLERVRQDPDLAELPVILLTAQTGDENASQGFERGADLYLAKPFAPDELVRWVRTVLGGFDAL